VKIDLSQTDEQAAEEYSEKSLRTCAIGCYEPGDVERPAFKAGAKWKQEQILALLRDNEESRSGELSYKTHISYWIESHLKSLEAKRDG